MIQGSSKYSAFLAYGLVVVGIVARLAPHPVNVTPLAGLALFGAYALTPRWLSLAVPLAAVVVSDAFIGWHDVVAFTWGSFLLTGLIGWWLRRRLTMRRLVGASVLSSTAFFLVTNFGVWWLGHEGTAYPHTWGGLMQCYAAALPFYRNMLLGDLVYASALVSAYRFCCTTWFRESSRAAPVRAA